MKRDDADDTSQLFLSRKAQHRRYVNMLTSSELQKHTSRNDDCFLGCGCSTRQNDYDQGYEGPVYNETDESEDDDGQKFYSA